MEKKSKIWLWIAIISFIVMFIFRIFNQPNLFGKNLQPNLALVAQVISGMIILTIIFGLYFRKRWAFYLTLVDIVFGLINHIAVITIFLIKPEILSQFLSQNIILNNTLALLYLLLTPYWAFLAYKLYKIRKIFH